MTDKIIGNELFWLAAMAPPLLFFLCLLGNRAGRTLKSIHHRLANRKPSRLALALGATIPLAFAAFITLQLLWAATDDYQTARCEREHTEPDWPNVLTKEKTKKPKRRWN